MVATEIPVPPLFDRKHCVHCLYFSYKGKDKKCSVCKNYNEWREQVKKIDSIRKKHDRDCTTCKYRTSNVEQEPCSVCKNYNEWYPEKNLDFCTSQETAPKDDEKEGKHDMSELPLDLLSELLCPAYKEGSDFKYFRNSWRKGFKLTKLMAACLRHLTKFFYEKEEYDQETIEKFGIKKHHLGAAMFCIIAMYHTINNYPELDDRFSKNKTCNKN